MSVGRSHSETIWLLLVGCACLRCYTDRQPASKTSSATSAPPVATDLRLTDPLDDPNMATLNIRRGHDEQAEILSFDGSPFDLLVGHHPQVGNVRVPLRLGTHELRVVVPGPCTYYDGRPGPGPSISNLRFLARAGIQYEVTIISFPAQLFDVMQVHVYEVVRPNLEFRSVEEVVSNEPAPSSCVGGRGKAQ